MRASVVVVALGLALAMPRYAHAKGCREISDVVGIERCKRYGQWSRESSLPRLWVDTAFLAQHIAVQPYSLATPPAAPLTLGGGVSPHEATANTYGYVQGVRYAFNPMLYTGLDFGWAWAVTPPVMPGPPTLHAMDFVTHVIAGAHVERFRVGLAGEVAVGPQIAAFDDCPDRACSVGKSVLQVTTDVEARVRLDFFLHPQFSLGVGYGQSLVTPDAHSLTIGLGIHVRALDGML